VNGCIVFRERGLPEGAILFVDSNKVRDPLNILLKNTVAYSQCRGSTLSKGRPRSESTVLSDLKPDP
jgi:hypothetical protein